jgi:HlyD family secretion protein
MNKRRLFFAVAGTVFCLTLAVAAVVVARRVSHPPAMHYLTGMAETAEIDVAGKVAGRIEEMRVSEGSIVGRDDTLACMGSRELDAKVGQARAALAAAKAKLTLANNGLRPQEKDAANRLYLQAKAQADLMEKTWSRVSKLAGDSVVSGQERDQVEAQYQAALEAREAAAAGLSLANEGTRAEDKSAAFALVAQAAQAMSEAQAWRDELVITSPISGEVVRRVAHKGEVVAAGAPILTLIDTADTWVVLMVKETDMKPLRMGAEFPAVVPALGDTSVNLTVAYVAPMGDFATWRPTSQKGGFDVKTFEIHLRPKTPVPGLRAGMSVHVKVD